MRYRIAGVFVMLAILLAVRGHADPAYWSRFFFTGSNVGGAAATFGTRPTTTDGYDPPSSDPYAPFDQAIYAGSNMYVATYHMEGSAWRGPTGFYGIDYRAPIALISGQSKTWTMYVWAVPSLSMGITAIWFEWDGYSPSPNNFHFTLTLKSKPADITGGPDEGTVWDLSAQPRGQVQLPVFRTTNGLEGYVFDFTATVVPEPSSLAALMGGLAGLGGFALRRRAGRSVFRDLRSGDRAIYRGAA